MATVTPKIGARGTQNINTAYNVSANTLISNRVVCSEFLGPELKNISFSTTNTDPVSSAPIGLVEQLRIDNSGNIAYFGAPEISFSNLVSKDVSCNIAYYNKAVDIYVATDHFADPSLIGYLKVQIYFSAWTAMDYVILSSKILAAANSSLGPGMTCAGYCVSRNQNTVTPFPNSVKWFRFQGTSGAVTVNNGFFALGGNVFRNFGADFFFYPDNKPDNIVAFINLIHATVPTPITDVLITVF